MTEAERELGVVAVGPALAVLAVLSPLAPGATAPQETKETRIPPTAHVDRGVLLPTKFKKGVPYKFAISGWVDVSPSASRKVDALYCFESAVGTPCKPPYVVGGVQLTWFKGLSGARSTYSHWTNFPSPPKKIPAYRASHTYDAVIVPKFDARLVVGVGGYDTDAKDNDGEGFTVKVTGPAPCKTKPTSRVQRSLKVTTTALEFCPAKAVVAANAPVTICNGDALRVKMFGLGEYQVVNLPGYDPVKPTAGAAAAAAKRSERLGKGKCLRFAVRNPTRRPIAMYLYVFPNDDDWLDYSEFRLIIQPERR